MRIGRTTSPPVDRAAKAEPRIELPAKLEFDPGWCIVEDRFVLTREHEFESLFAVGNGYVGTRGSVVEGTGLSAPGTFVAGVYDRPTPEAIPELAPMPDWTHVDATIDGRRLRMDAVEPLRHQRTLDMRHGELWREWRMRDPAGRVTSVRGLRLASQADRHLLLQSIVFTPENYGAKLRVQVELEQSHVVRTSSGVEVVLANASFLESARGRMRLPVDHGEPIDIEVEPGHTYRLDRIVCIASSRETEDPQRTAESHLARVLEQKSVEELIAEHRRAWRKLWSACDVCIDGDLFAQRAVRFAIYHLLSAANPDDDRVSIGARSLSGAAYKGHVFWD